MLFFFFFFFFFPFVITFKKKSAPSNALHLPFIVVNTPKQTVIDCQMAEDKSEYFFDFSSPFEIHDDIEILKRMGLAYGLEAGTCSVEVTKKKERKKIFRRKKKRKENLKGSKICRTDSFFLFFFFFFFLCLRRTWPRPRSWCRRM